jgi:hypothetical protein
MTDAAAGGNASQRRFRQRGGAKKKKKRQELEHPKPDGLTEIATREASHVSAVSAYRAPSEFKASAFVESPLDPELVQYLLQLRNDIEALGDAAQQQYDDQKADNSDEPSPLLLLSRNALMSLMPNMHEVSMDPMGSHILETLIQGARPDSQVLGDVLSGVLALGARRISALADHRCGSHVLQSLVQAVLERARFGTMAPTSSSTGNSLDTAVDALLRLLTNDWTVDELVAVMSSSCGSHVFRVVVAGLAGLPVEEPKEQKLDDSSGSKRIKSYVDRLAVQVPDDWLAAIGSITERLLESDKGDGLHGMLWAPSSCAALQGLLSAVVRYDRELAKRLAVVALKDSILDLSYDACGARFVERAVVCLGAVVVLPSLKGNFALMAADSKANYVVQRVLLGLKGRGAVMSLWDELEPSLPTMVGYASVRDGVVLAMLRSAEVEGDEQVRRRAARAIAKNIGAIGGGAKHLCGVLITGNLNRWESWRSGVQEWAESGLGAPADVKPEDEKSSVLRLDSSVPRISLLGVLMARCLMRFPGGPGQAARDSMSNLRPVEVLALCADPTGSRLIEQWVDSDEEHGASKAASSVITAVLDARENAGLLSGFARNPYGAQVLIRVLALVPSPLKRTIMEGLAARAEHLKEHPHGRQVIRKCRVFEFIRRQDDWNAVESARDTRVRMFADILDVDSSTKDSKRRDIGGKKHKGKGYDKATPERTLASPEKPDSAPSLLKCNDLAHERSMHGTREESRRKKRSVPAESRKKGEETDQVDLGCVLSATENAANGKPKTKKQKRNNLPE